MNNITDVTDVTDATHVTDVTDVLAYAPRPGPTRRRARKQQEGIHPSYGTDVRALTMPEYVFAWSHA